MTKARQNLKRRVAKLERAVHARVTHTEDGADRKRPAPNGGKTP